MIPRASASFHPWDPEHILLVASSVKKKRHSDWKAGPVLALSFGSDTGCLVDQSNSPKVQECWLPLIISLNGKIMLGESPLLIEQQCFGLQGCRHIWSSFWWTYRPTNLLHFFPWDLQHAPSSKSTQIHFLLVQPSAPQVGGVETETWP